MSTVSADVYQNNSLIGLASNRPRRNTPLGITGIVYHGLVYPVIYDNDRGLYIDLDSESYDPNECTFWPARKESNWYQKSNGEDSTAHYVETNQFGHYFVFDGTHELFQSIDGFSQTENLLPYISSGESFRPANNGIQYDWYIRFDLTCDPKKIPVLLLPAIDNFFERTKSSFEEDSSLADIDLSRLESKQEEIQAKIETLIEELDRKDQQIDDERKEQSQLNIEIQKLKLALNNYEHGEERGSDKIREYEIFLDEIAKENQILKANKDKVDCLNNSLVAKNAELEKELAKKHSINGSKALKKKVYDLNAAYLRLLDRLYIDPDSIDTMLSKFCDYSHLLQILHDINDGNNVQAHSIHGRGNREPLYEVTAHIRTGTEGIMNMGRIYYKINPSEDRIEVFIHIKKNNTEQQRFIKSIP